MGCETGSKPRECLGTTQHHAARALAKIEKLVNWNAFTPIIQPMYTNQGPSGGRPYMDPVLMVKLLVLQAWYGLSDPELERQAGNRIDFMHFLGFPEKAPDYSTVWRFRERLAESGRDRLVWKELQSARAPPEKACLECHDVSKVHAFEVMLTDCVTCHDFLVNNDQLIPQRADCLE
jgi:hypothetical protein